MYHMFGYALYFTSRIWSQVGITKKCPSAPESTLQSCIQENLSNKVWQSDYNLNLLKPLAILNHVLSQTAVVELTHSAHWWSLRHMKHISPLISVGTVCSNPQLQWQNEVMIQYYKKKDKQALIVSLVHSSVANCCCMPIGNRITDRAPCCLLKKHWHHKEHLCVAVRDWHQ